MGTKVDIIPGGSKPNVMACERHARLMESFGAGTLVIDDGVALMLSEAAACMECRLVATLMSGDPRYLFGEETDV
jgi:hypothetical protein